MSSKNDHSVARSNSSKTMSSKNDHSVARSNSSRRSKRQRELDIVDSDDEGIALLLHTRKIQCPEYTKPLDNLNPNKYVSVWNHRLSELMVKLHFPCTALREFIESAPTPEVLSRYITNGDYRSILWRCFRAPSVNLISKLLIDAGLGFPCPKRHFVSICMPVFPLEQRTDATEKLLSDHWSRIINSPLLGRLARLSNIFSVAYHRAVRKYKLDYIAIAHEMSKLSDRWEATVIASDEASAALREFRVGKLRQKIVPRTPFVARNSDENLDDDLAESLRLADILVNENMSEVEKLVAKHLRTPGTLDKAIVKINPHDDGDPALSQSIPEYISKFISGWDGGFASTNYRLTLFALSLTLTITQTGTQKILPLMCTLATGYMLYAQHPSIREFLKNPVRLIVSLTSKISSVCPPFSKHLIEKLSAFLKPLVGGLWEKVAAQVNTIIPWVDSPLQLFPALGSCMAPVRTALEAKLPDTVSIPQEGYAPASQELPLPGSLLSHIDNFRAFFKLRHETFHHPLNYLSLIKNAVVCDAPLQFYMLAQRLAVPWERHGNTVMLASNPTKALVYCIFSWMGQETMMNYPHIRMAPFAPFDSCDPIEYLRIHWPNRPPGFPQPDCSWYDYNIAAEETLRYNAQANFNYFEGTAFGPAQQRDSDFSTRRPFHPEMRVQDSGFVNTVEGHTITHGPSATNFATTKDYDWKTLRPRTDDSTEFIMFDDPFEEPSPEQKPDSYYNPTKFDSDPDYVPEEDIFTEEEKPSVPKYPAPPPPTSEPGPVISSEMIDGDRLLASLPNPLEHTGPISSTVEIPPTKKERRQARKKANRAARATTQASQTAQFDWVSFVETATNILDNSSSIGGKVFQERCRNFNTLMTTFNKLTPFVAWIPACLLSIIDWLGVSITGVSPSFCIPNNVLREIDALLAETIKVKALVSNSTDTALMVENMTKLSVRFASVQAHLHMVDTADRRFQAFRAASKDFNDAFVIVRARHASNHPRHVPLCICLPGPAGLGKTNFAQQMAKELSIPLENSPALLDNADIYTMSFGANFQDGLTTQSTILADEFSSINSKEMRTEQLIWFLGIVNSTQLNIEKARVEEKGMYYNNAQLVVLTTNDDLTVMEGLLADPYALRRRIHFSIAINPPTRDEHGQFPQLPNGAIDWSRFSFTVTTPNLATRGFTTRENCSFSQVFSLMRAEMLRTRNDFNRNVGAGNTLVSQVDHAAIGPLPPGVPVEAVHVPLGEATPSAPYKPAKRDVKGTQNPRPPHARNQGIVSVTHSPFNFENDEQRTFYSRLMQAKHRLSADPLAYCKWSSFLQNFRHETQTFKLPLQFDGLPSEFVHWQIAMVALGASNIPLVHTANLGETTDSAFLESLAEYSQIPEMHDADSPPNCCSASWLRTKHRFNNIKKQLFSYLPSALLSESWTYLKSKLTPIWAALRAAALVVVGVFVSYAIYKTLLASPTRTNTTTPPFSTPLEERISTALSTIQGSPAGYDEKGDSYNDRRRAKALMNENGTFLHGGKTLHIKTSHRSSKTSHGGDGGYEKRQRADERRKQEERARGGKGRGGKMFYQQADIASTALTTNRNTFFIHTSGDTKYRCFSTGGRFAVMPHHYLASLLTAGPCTIIGFPSVPAFDFMDLDIYIRPDIDFASFVLPVQMPQFPDISHRFITYDDIAHTNSQFVHHIKTDTNTMNTWSLSGTTNPTVQTWSDSDYAPEESTYVSSVFAFDHSTVFGDCGSLYATQQGNVGPRQFIGYHVAGTGRKAICSILCQEDIEAMHEAFDYDSLPLAQGPVPGLRLPSKAPRVPLEEIDSMFQPDDTVTPDALLDLQEYPSHPPQATIIRIDPSDALHMTKTTRLVKGPLHGLLGTPIKAPALMSRCKAGNFQDPLLKAYERFTGPTLKLDDRDPNILRQAAQQTLTHVSRYPNGMTRTLNENEAILGYLSLAPMKLTSSAGEPYNTFASKQGKKPSKSSFIQVPMPNFVTIDPTLQADVNSLMEQLKRGEVPDWYVTDQLKDEPVSLEKIALAKTRLYFAAPVSMCLIGRMLFGTLLSALEDSRLTSMGLSSCAVGMTTDDRIVRAMFTLPEANNIFAMDQKGFDQHQSWDIAKHVSSAINEWYAESPELSLARHTYLYSCYHSVHRVGSITYQVDFGMPSGIPITSQLNSLYLETVTLASVHIWSRDYPTKGDARHPQMSSLPLRKIKNGAFCLFYGDDSWVALPKSVGITSQDFFKGYDHYGLVSTHCVKDWPLDQEIPVSEITFLKRKPLLNEDGILVFQKDLGDISTILDWTRKSNYGDWVVVENAVRSVLLEARLHGVTIFNQFLKRIIEGYSNHQRAFTLSTDPADYLAL